MCAVSFQSKVRHTYCHQLLHMCSFLLQSLFGTVWFTHAEMSVNLLQPNEVLSLLSSSKCKKQPLSYIYLHSI